MFKKLKGLFVLEEEGAASSATKASEKKVKADTKSSEDIPDVNIDYPSETSKKGGKPDDKFVDILLKAVEKNNSEGFDYLEYKSSLQSLTGMDMDEATKYKSALAMAKTMGATPEKLISSANHYIKVLKKEHVKFKEALKNQKTKQVTGREGDIKSTLSLIDQKKQKITQLQKEIAADEKKLEKLKAGINQAAAKVQATSDNFNYAYNVVTGQIQSDVQKMKSYLT